MPGLAIVAAVAAAAQKGGAFWGTVKSLLPQVKLTHLHFLTIASYIRSQIQVTKGALLCRAW